MERQRLDEEGPRGEKVREGGVHPAAWVERDRDSGDKGE